MSVLKLAGSRSQLKAALEQADARERLRAAAAADDPDPYMVLADIAKLSQRREDAVYAVAAAKAVQRAAEARIAAANLSTHLPDVEEWTCIVAHFGLDSTKNISDAEKLAYARSFRGLRR